MLREGGPIKGTADSASTPHFSLWRNVAQTGEVHVSFSIAWLPDHGAGGLRGSVSRETARRWSHLQLRILAARRSAAHSHAAESALQERFSAI